MARNRRNKTESDTTNSSSTNTGRFKKIAWCLAGTVAIIAIVIAIRFGTGSQIAFAQTGSQALRIPGAPQATVKPMKIMAIVNGQRITREELAGETVRQYGDEVIEQLIARRLIGMHCEQRGITITQQDIQDEIATTAKKLRLPVDQFLNLIQEQRGTTPTRYADEVIWPTIAQRRLAGAEIKVTQEEMQALYESNYGPRVHVRLIAVRDQQLAEKVYQLATTGGESFERLATKYSVDVDSASNGGRILPIRKNLGEPKIEQAAFSLSKDDIAAPIPVGDQWVILKCDGHTPARPLTKEQIPTIRTMLEDEIRSRKLRAEGNQLYKKLFTQSQIKNIFNDPIARKKMPGIAATVNGQPITVLQLADAAIGKYGEAVLLAMATKTLLNQSLVKANLQVTQADVNAEVGRAALAEGLVTDDGQPDYDRWIKTMTESENITKERYINEAVWPTCALKKLVGGNVKVTQEDLKRGFEANFGPRVRVRAILLKNHRRALEVWNMARQTPTVENFARLATEYSVERGSRELGGEVPPIQRHGGQPTMEKHAFELKQGEISGVIQVGELFVILYCEGYTKPIDVQFETVRDEIHADIAEKKLRMAMATKFEQIYDASTIENYLTPQHSHRPAAKIPANKVPQRAPAVRSGK